MISQELITQEFIQVVKREYPNTGQLLDNCYVKVLDFSVKRLEKRFYYVAVYCPKTLISELRSQSHLFKEIAENMGLMDVVFIKSNNLLRDPLSKIKQDYPRLWLELHSVISPF
ncbi:hypothetical protein PCC9214_03035 [Planktothrix tepida]|uniref:Uncharacterized protein n=1 Tax=Planktothrix tepida PCC 9214 TaxID=671072 RepID=A0A1J1LRG0_9CYAN|nr:MULTISPECIES: hypothetical protein [Planktothrix]CAD5958641.1 hypothetical protein PCC9214_03035 [Planktothrix tepida]CUR34586.1 conserved hypothetical protein [Planktothrix tepida PCC 9214]